MAGCRADCGDVDGPGQRIYHDANCDRDLTRNEPHVKADVDRQQCNAYDGLWLF